MFPRSLSNNKIVIFYARLSVHDNKKHEKIPIPWKKIPTEACLTVIQGWFVIGQAFRLWNTQHCTGRFCISLGRSMVLVAYKFDRFLWQLLENCNQEKKKQFNYLLFCKLAKTERTGSSRGNPISGNGQFSKYLFLFFKSFFKDEIYCTFISLIPKRKIRPSQHFVRQSTK